MGNDSIRKESGRGADLLARRDKGRTGETMSNVTALLNAIFDQPHEATPRLMLADALDERSLPGDEERAAVIRSQRDPFACQRYAAWLESNGATGLLEFAQLQTRHLTYRGKRTAAK